MILDVNVAMNDLGQQLGLIATLRVRHDHIDDETYVFEQRLRKSYSLLLDLQDSLVNKIVKDYKDATKKRPAQ